MAANVIKMSVRDLVEFILRSGDIDNRRTDSMTKNAMAEGSRIHRKIQNRMGANYRAEVPLKISMEYTDYEICLEGRADGIITEEDTIVIDEIKSMYADVNRLKEPVPVHLAQAMCYAYIYCRQQGLKEIDVQLTYCNIETEAVRRFRETHSYEDLEVWFESVISQYLVWAEFITKERKLRQESIVNLEFPFEYREGQRNIVVSVYKAVKQRRNMFIQAPTGVGKTISTIFPAVRAVGEEAADKIFYLTAKTITRTVAEEAFRTLRKTGLHFKTVTITAKDKICSCEKTECNPLACPRAKGHYDRINGAVFDVISSESDINREVIERYAEQYNVCPFEMSLDISSFMDGIICDYNYVFDPYVCLKRYFSEGVQGSYIFLVDEAHNLVERAREMYSAVLVKEDFLACKKLIKDKSGSKLLSGSTGLEKALEKCNREMLSLKRECTGTEGNFTYTMIPDTEELVLTLLRLQSVMEKFLDDNREFEHRSEVMDFYFVVRNYLDMYELTDENYVIYTDFRESGEFYVKLFCVNPSGNVADCMRRGYSTIFFSATLLPVNYYKELLSGNTEDYAIYIDSPFDSGKRLLTVAKDVSSKYSRRGREEYLRMLQYIEEVAGGCKGNYMVFFPSYQLMNEVYTLAYEQGITEIYDVVCQDSNMNEQAREEFLAGFQADNPKSMLGFCVLGGIFSEGIDLKNERLIGCIIIGTGLPQVCSERDQRFLERSYQMLFPREWADFGVTDVHNVGEMIGRFWRYC